MKIYNKIIWLSISTAFAAGAMPAMAGGFAIGTQSGSAIGNANAGGAAAAEDASVVWSNPAGMTALPAGKQITGAVHAIKPSFKFGNTGSTGFFAAPGTGDGGDGGGWAYVPSGFFAMDITPALRFGVALTAPFGLKTDYDFGWRGAATGLESSIKTININPALAYKVNDSFSIGGGLNVQKIDAKLTSFIPGGPGVSTLDADDWGYGYNLGVTFQPSPATRIGATYRSAIKYNLKGSATFSGVGAFNGPVTADLKTPDSASFSVFHSANSKWDVMADISWTGWSNLQQLTVVRTAASLLPAPAPGGAASSVLTTLPFSWDNTWRYSVGANYKMSDQVKLRFGLAFDQTPTHDSLRTPRLPDQDRTWLAIGVQYKPSKQGTLELGYAHEFVKDATVNVAVPPLPGALVGTFKNKADIISIQYSHSF
jgi:long-chain fatty acid transport protein